MKDSEISKYLSRIKVDDCKPNFEYLSKLQEFHMANIPFENLDIIVGRKIGLDINHLYDKIIIKKRGGYCFELNTLYAKLLTNIGYKPRPVLGRVWLSNPKSTPPRNHLAYLLELDKKTYITDVGFGGLTASIPLDIHVSSTVTDKDGMVRVIPFREHQHMIQRQTEKGWTNLYSFEEVEISEQDISISNYYMSTHPHSHFHDNKFVGKITEEGRVALFNNKMSIRKGIHVVAKNRVEYGDKWLEIIKNEFSLDLDFTKAEYDALLRDNT